MTGPLSKANLVQQTKKVAEIESSFRIYIREWLFEGRRPSLEKAREEVVSKYEGRVRPEDLRVIQDWDETWVVMVRRWNVAAEMKTEQLAAEVMDALAKEGYEVTIVARNSRAEHELARYGVTMLPKDK